MRVKGPGQQSGEGIASRAISRVVREVDVRSEQRSAVDLIVARLMERPQALSLANPVRYVELLRRAFLPVRFDVHTLHNRAEHAERAGQFQYFLDELQRGVPPLCVPDALRMADVADELGASREPMGWVDVGSHFGRASSFARKGRLLQSAIRHVRAKKVIELGTAYGMGTLFLASAVGADGAVTTVEYGQPMARIGGENVRRHFPDTVHALVGRSTDMVPEVAKVSASYDVFFHDAEHSRQAYIDDFAAYEPLLGSGAIAIYDDIRWARARQLDTDPDPYAGWLEVTRHSRVLHAAEVDGEYGVLLLS